MWLLVGAVAVAVLLPLAIEHFRIRAELGRAASTLPAELAKARALKIPLEWDDLDPHLPPEQNAAPLYLQAIAKFKKLPPETVQDLFPVRGALDAPKRRKALETYVDVLPLLERASRVPHCFFERDWSRVWNEGLAPLAQMKTLVKLACAKAEWEARAGRMESGIAWLQVGATLSRHVGEEPSLMGWMTQGSAEYIVTGSLQRIVDPEQITDRQITLLRSVVDKMGADPIRGLQGEFALRFHFYEGLDEMLAEYHPRDGWWGITEAFGYSPFGQQFNPRAFLPAMQDRKLVERAYQARVLSRWIPYLQEVKAASGDPKRLDRASTNLQIAITKGTNRIDRAEGQLSDYETSTSYKRKVAGHRMALQALDVLAFRVRTGRLPKTLAEVGTPLLDPFDDKPLRYKPLPPGFLLYSVDADGSDDGGIPRSRGTAGDLPFPIPKRP